jgi:DNA-binding MarR family transcriptional regulator
VAVRRVWSGIPGLDDRAAWAAALRVPERSTPHLGRIWIERPIDDRRTGAFGRPDGLSAVRRLRRRSIIVGNMASTTGQQASVDDLLVADLDRLARALVAATAVAIAAATPTHELTIQQWRIVVLLAWRGSMRLRDVAAALHASQPSASRLVSRLERDRLVERLPAPGDGRGTIVHLTGDGLAIHDAVVGFRRREFERVLSGLSLPSGTSSSLAAIADALEDGP